VTIAYRIALTVARRLSHATATVRGMANSFLTRTLTTGGRHERVRWVDGRPTRRVTQCVTVIIDHDVGGGGAATRFGQTRT
jgi:hypothetical protein